MERGSTPQNLDELDLEFFELTELRTVEWCPTRDGQGPPTQVHLLMQLAGRQDVRFVVRFQGPEVLSGLITALTGHGLNVFGAALRERLRETEARWRAQGEAL